MASVDAGALGPPLFAAPSPSTAASWFSPRRVLGFWLWLFVALGTAAFLGTQIVDGDTGDVLGRAVASVGHGVGHLVGHPAWQYVPLVVAVAGIHYALAAVALRAAAGRSMRIPLREATLVQFVATAANRITPTGLGGAAVNVRYLSRRGLPVSGAVGAVASLGPLGALADLLVLALVLTVGSVVGARGGWTELHVVASRLAHSLTGARLSPLVLIGVGIAVLAALAVGALLTGRAGVRPMQALRNVRGAVGRCSRQITSMRRRPRDLLVLLLASGGTTLVLGLALIGCVAAVAGAPAAGNIGGLLAGYLVAAAVAGAVPIPAGIGSTETVLVAAMVAGHVPLGQAISAVLLFRAITFWAPALVGLAAAPRLRRSRAL